MVRLDLIYTCQHWLKLFSMFFLRWHAVNKQGRLQDFQCWRLMLLLETPDLATPIAPGKGTTDKALLAREIHSWSYKPLGTLTCLIRARIGNLQHMDQIWLLTQSYLACLELHSLFAMYWAGHSRAACPGSQSPYVTLPPRSSSAKPLPGAWQPRSSVMMSLLNVTAQKCHCQPLI